MAHNRLAHNCVRFLCLLPWRHGPTNPPPLPVPAVASQEDRPVSSVWYVERDSEPVGPMSAAQLKRLADDGKLKPTDRVRRDEGAWVAASTVKGLFSPAPSQPGAAVPAPVRPSP